MAAKTLKTMDLRAATAASIQAVLGKRFPGRPGVLVGLWLDRGVIGKLGIGPAQIAKDISKQVSVTSGIKVTPGTKAGPGGVLVGYIQPRIFK